MPPLLDMDCQATAPPPYDCLPFRHTHAHTHTHEVSPPCSPPTSPPPPPPPSSFSPWRASKRCRREDPSVEKKHVEKLKGATLQIVDVDLQGRPGDPVYELRLSVNGRTYYTTRSHNRLRVLVERIRRRGYPSLRPFPDVCEVIRMMNATSLAEAWGDAWASVASTFLHRPAMVSMRKRRHRKQHVLRGVGAFFHAVFGRVEPLVLEEEVATFLWEPIDAQLQPVMEDDDSDSDDTSDETD